MHDEFKFLTEVHQALLRANIDSHDPEQRAHLQVLIKEAWERAKAETHRPPLIFKTAPHGREWIIGVEGAEQCYRSDLRGLSAAHLAIQHGAKSSVFTRDFAEPGANYPDTIVRKAIRKHASEWLIRNGNPELATVFLGIKVEAGIVQYAPSRGAPKVITF
jgi:hypothetical protein